MSSYFQLSCLYEVYEIEKVVYQQHEASAQQEAAEKLRGCLRFPSEDDACYEEDYAEDEVVKVEVPDLNDHYGKGP